MNPHEETSTPKVHVLDDDVGVCQALERLLLSAGLEVRTHCSPAAFLDAHLPSDRGCLLLDMQFPGTNGLDFQSQLVAEKIAMPVIIMTGHADIASSIRALKSGATDFLIKPFDDEEMLAAVGNALEVEEGLWIARAAIEEADRRFETLTTREREVFALVTTGLMNKQMAGDLGLSEVTVKIHRGTMMRKMEVRTLADLVRVSETLKLRDA